ncbi:MAG: hypothetical protein ACI9OJ_005430, partial [Myxococcota bacterium]
PVDHRLAEHVRDNGPADSPFPGEWNLYDLANSALLLDDVSPLLRAQLFAQLGSRVFDAENPLHELAWRRTYSQIFERAYLNRRMECLTCHNSAFSVTGSSDPALNRTWPAPGLVERAIFGADEGRAVTDVDAFFRLGGVFAMSLVPDGLPEMPDIYWKREEGIRPWGIIHECGEFEPESAIEPDPLGQMGYLVDAAGDTASVWKLERLLREGFERLRADGVNPDQNGELGGREALAWMVSLSLAERIWEQLTGASLTTPHGFPRTSAQRDYLLLLANRLVSSGFSLKETLMAAVLSPLFNPAAPADCEHPPYHLPTALNPWVLQELDEVERANSAGDGLVRVPPRILVRSAAASLDWLTEENFVPPEGGFEDQELADAVFSEFTDRNAAFETDIGLFVLDGEPGFRGSSFREAVAWEATMGPCIDPAPELLRADRLDWIGQLLSDPPAQATLGDLVGALKNRITADPDLSDAEERDLLATHLGVPLDTPSSEVDDLDTVLRRACTAFLSSPQFLLDGISWPDAGAAQPSFPGPASSSMDTCEPLAKLFGGASCADGRLEF